MTTKQLSALFVVQLSIFTSSGAVGALLPIDMTRMGADPSAIGFYMALIITGTAVGVIGSGWLSDRLQQRKRMLIGAGLLQIIAMGLTAQAVNLWQLTLAAIFVTLCMGTGIAMVSALAGLFAEPAQRGRVFGTIASALGVGFLIGGSLSGPIVDRWGFPGLFVASAVVSVVQPLAGLFLTDKHVERPKPGSKTAGNLLLTSAFLLLFVASVLAFVVNGMQGLARSLIMDQLHFNAADVLSTVVVSGFITLPLPILIGWLSDRLGRKPLIVLCYLANAASVLILVGSGALWHFWLSTALTTLTGASLGVGLALVTDLIPAEGLGTGLAWFGATNWFGIIIGSLLTGSAIQALGMTTTLILGGVVGALGIGLLFLVRRPAAKSEPALA